ncbi:hypothetical protein VII00023_18359 [Vibrio ichthyoenteri ATCC 700023]|uniref:Metallopeptidase n=1 Tax=Vibrio ichthyoenteri ATCC 700023 TaxID=870968 RepID=F9S0L6_9VIBR|nr:DUF4344 domain-containing metallopeptidase [Vibrio ichthyoenteri]EGU43158.1 hypothetical protein VII00023_18359 [Vibrio ichthyoenteri ATCC 700023]
MHIRYTPFLLIACALFSPASAALDTIEFKYLPPANPNEQQAQSAIKESEINPLVADLANQYFPFSQTLTVQYGGEEGPLYDPEIHTIHIPYEFYHQALQYFIANNYQEKYGRSPQLGTIDTLLHTLLHEAGHAYIADRNIPVLGKEEDAVDNFAAIIMLEYIEGGDEATISAADMFAFESQQRPDYYDWGEYIDEHSFDLQRYFSTLCLVYGNDPKKYATLLNEIEQDYLSERQQFCRYQYQAINNNWHRYLHEPYQQK